jgi:hypothetical protein
MRKSWILRTGVTAACAAIIACGGSDGANQDRPAQTADRRPEQPGQTQPAAQAQPQTQSQAPAAALVSLSGCLEAAPGTDQFVLRNVRVEPRAGDPHATTTTPGGHGITEGAWVRVDGKGQDLRGHLGQRVLLKGAVLDDGRNTIGTAGAPGVPSPTGDTSQAASREHHSDKQKKEMGRIARESMADGTAAKVEAREVTATGDRCAAPQPSKD